MWDDASVTPEKAGHANYAYEEVLRRLRGGRIGPDDRIVDKALAAELDMSRMPAREALLRLVNEGYLIGSTRGFRLPQLAVADILEIFELRFMLEPRAAASSVKALTDDALLRLEGAYMAALAASQQGDAVAMNDALGTFRAVWLDAVPNRRQASVIERFFDQVYAIRRATLDDPEARNTSITILTAIHDGFQKRDPLAVCDRMASFIEASRLSFLSRQDEYSHLFKDVDALV